MIALLVGLAVVLLIAVAQLPPVGSTQTPVHTHVSAHYVEHGVAETGAPNLVTAVLLNYRGLDTFGEILVLFTALSAGLAVLLTAAGPGRRLHDKAAGSGNGEQAVIEVSPIVSFIVRLLAPFVALFGVYVILHGHVEPGGGFQGGMVLAALFIALRFVLGEPAASRLLPAGLRPWLYAAAPLAFVAVGMAGLALTGHFLGYPTDPSFYLVREAMLIVLEVAVGVGSMVVIAGLFLAMERA